MKLIYDPVQDHRQLRALIRVLILTETGKIVSGMSMRVQVEKMYGLGIDHHEFAYELDAMTRTHTDRVVYYNHNGGNTQYRILEEK